MASCDYRLYESDCEEKVFDPDDCVSVAAASTIVQAKDDVEADWPESSWVGAVARAPWRKSSRSAGNGNCVEVALRNDLVGVRDSKEAGEGPVLLFNGAAWRSFIESVKEGN